MKKTRLNQIDFLRAVAITGVITIHVFSYYLNKPVYSFLWNYLHFVLPIFIFCSGYVLFIYYQNHFNRIELILSWWKKRFVRLLLPFYLYLFGHYLLMVVLPNFFSGLSLKKEVNFIIQSITLTGGIDLNWLVLLFLELSLIFPLIVYLAKKPFWFKSLFILSIISSIWFFFKKPAEYRFVMWLPWSCFLFLAILFYFFNKKNLSFKKKILYYLRFFVVTVSIFLFFLLIKKPNKFILFQHKYPPNIVYLSYGLIFLTFFLLISQLSIVNHLFFKKIYQLISKNSYSLYFIHYLVIDFFKTTRQNFILSQPLTLLFLTITISFGVSLFFAYIKKELLKFIF